MLKRLYLRPLAQAAGIFRWDEARVVLAAEGVAKYDLYQPGMDVTGSVELGMKRVQTAFGETWECLHDVRGSRAPTTPCALSFFVCAFLLRMYLVSVFPVPVIPPLFAHSWSRLRHTLLFSPP